ncbi:50S ribosomal protein L21 [Candidatus Gracilibacteria bacterium]|nr:50S ribosomal protein L21 [Thermales bacterium]NJL96984.1 50S ribosomal protein L21 [Candidatus Gracilibacteria bacterium]NJS41365.1 50S ribosomal protein L21 [Candidatus Gracilibacteria bacterium]
MPFVVQSGSHQYLTDFGQKIIVNKLDAKENSTIELNVLHGFGDFKNTSTVKAKVIKQQKGPKLRVVKYKSKSNYHRQYGPRQQETILEILK